MKKLNLRIGMAFLAGLFLFSCSNEDDFLTQVSPDTENTVPNAEDAAFQDVVKQLNALNAKYGVNPETRIVVGDDIGKQPVLSPSMLRIVSSDVLGTVVAIRTNVPKAVVTSIITSIRAFTKSTENIKPDIDLWIKNGYINSYVANFGSTFTGADMMGDIHNKIVQTLYNKYGIALVNMSDAQLQTAVCEEWNKGTIQPPHSFVPVIDNINFIEINNIIKTNNYAVSLTRLSLQNIITKNEYDLMSSFLVGLNKVPTSDLMSYCAGARQVVYYSSLAPAYRDYLCAAVSIGFASRHLWK